MKTWGRVVGVLLLVLLTTLRFPGVAQAQYGSSGGDKDKPKTPAEEVIYDYYADVAGWTAEYGQEGGAGDWRYYHNPLYGAGGGDSIGWADGYCIQTAPGAYAYCQWSLYSDNWTLSAHGVLDEATGDNWYAISGGTGEYQDAHGYLHWSANADGSQYYYTVEAQDYVAYDPLVIVADAGNAYETYWYDPAYTYANVQYWHTPIYGEDEANQIGWSNGYCVATGPNRASECTWTAWGDGWALNAAGVKADEGKSWLTITGGYGTYAGASGYVGWETSADGTQNWYDYYFDYTPATYAKTGEVYIQTKGFLYGDVPAAGEAAGDVYSWHAPLWDANQTYKIGWSDGYCVLTAPEQWSTCTFSLYTDNWTLTGSGPTYETGSASTVAISGGTGAYAYATGNIVVTPEANSPWLGVAINLYAAPDYYWDWTPWDSLTEEEQAAWYTLGWDADRWDGAQPAAAPASEGRPWAELTPYEQEAATYVGYDESSWNATSPRTPEGDPDSYWEAYDWDELYLSEQRLWGLLGWNADNWALYPEAAMPTSNLRPWQELTPVEQGAAAALGYDEASWDVAIVRTPEGNVEEYWAQYSWEELSYGEKQLFAYLGWNADRWVGDAPIPESKYRTWEQLSYDEKGAASHLGYDAASWDAGVLTH